MFLLLLLLRGASAFTLMSFQFSVLFPDTPMADATRLLHSPECWGDGRVALLGLMPFAPQDVSGPFVCGAERAVAFTALGNHVRLMSSRRQSARIQLREEDGEPHTTIYANLIPVQQGVSLEVNVICDWRGDAAYTARMLRLCGLFGPTSDYVENKALLLYRNGLRD
jgi:hypothetical protein